MNKNLTIARIENDLIFSGQYQLTAKEQKLVLFLISKVNPIAAENKFAPEIVSVNKLGKLLLGKPKGSFYTEINKFISRLMTKRISFVTQATIKSKPLPGHVNWFSSIIGCYNKEDEPSFKFQFSDNLRPFLLDLKEYTQIDYLEILPLKSSFSIRMYQIFKAQRSKMAKHQNKSAIQYDLQPLKTLLEIEDKYKDFRNFRKKVLLPIETEINKHTSLMVKTIPIKEGRKIVGIKFEFWEKRNHNPATKSTPKILHPSTLTFAQTKALKQLIHYGIQEGVALELLSRVGGSESIGFEDWYFETTIQLFESKTRQQTPAAKAGTFVNWFIKKKVFEQGDMFAKIMERLQERKKELQSTRPDAWQNRLLAKTITYQAFKEQLI